MSFTLLKLEDIGALDDTLAVLRRRIAFSSSVQTRVLSKIGQMTGNGMGLVDTIHLLADRARTRGRSQAMLVAILEEWHSRLLNGSTLAEAVAGDVPESDRILLRAGENSGQLSRAVAAILKLRAARAQIMAAIWGGLAYPTGLIVMTLSLMGVVKFQVIASMAAVVAYENWPLPTRALDLVSGAIFNGLPFLMAGGLLLAALIMWGLPRWTGLLRVRAERFMPWSLYKIYYGVGFLIALAALVREGVKEGEALLVISRDVSAWYQERMRAALRRMANGEKVATALFNTGFDFPDREILDDLRVYENVSTFDEMLTSLAEQALEAALARIKTKMRVFFYLGLGTVTATIAWVYLSVVMLVMQMTSGGV